MLASWKRRGGTRAGDCPGMGPCHTRSRSGLHGTPKELQIPQQGCEVGRGFISALTVHGMRGNQGAPSGAPCDGFSGLRQGTLQNSWPGVVLVCVDRGCLPLRAPGACMPRIGRIGSGPVCRHCRAVTQTPLETGGPRAWGVQTRKAVTPTPLGAGGPQAWCADVQVCYPHAPGDRGALGPGVCRRTGLSPAHPQGQGPGRGATGRPSPNWQM